MGEEETTGLTEKVEIVISLLGRLAFKEDKVRDIVRKAKRNPDKYVEGYNACDGQQDVSEIARVVGVRPTTLSPILKKWGELGIIYEVQKSGGRFYKKLFPIENEERKSTKQTKKG
jgi:DNA-binding transcriptional ArsR family regulator